MIKSFLLSLLVAIAATACASSNDIVEPEPPSFGVPVVERLPLRVGYSFDQSVAEVHRLKWGAPGQHTEPYRVGLGPATRTAFGRVFSALFLEARPVADVPSVEQAPRDFDGIIRVGITDASMAWDGDWVEVTYQLTFLNPDGTQEGQWRVAGLGKTGTRWVGEVGPAIRMAAAKVARDLDQQPAIGAWLEPLT